MARDKNDVAAYHHVLAVHFHAMAIGANTKNPEADAQARSVDERLNKQNRPFLTRPLAVFVGIVMGAAPVAAFLIAEIDQKNI